MLPGLAAPPLFQIQLCSFFSFLFIAVTPKVITPAFCLLFSESCLPDVAPQGRSLEPLSPASSSGYRTNVKAHQHALGVGQISDNLFKRFRQLSYQCRYSNYLVPFGKLGILQKVNHLYTVFTCEVLFTDLL